MTREPRCRLTAGICAKRVSDGKEGVSCAERTLCSAAVPTTIPVRVVRDCPVVGQPVVLSRDQVFLDYLLMSESQPTCSNIHNCVTQYGDIKNIEQCLLHSPSKHFPAEEKP